MTEMTLYALDELNNEVELTTVRIPYANGELTDRELNLMFEIELSRIWIAPEWNHIWLETNYRTKEELEREQKVAEEAYTEWCKDNAEWLSEYDEGEWYGFYAEENLRRWL